jgi:hypothetical protein
MKPKWRIAKDRHEKSTFLEERTIKAFCPMCESSGRNPYFKHKVKVQHHVVLPKKYRKFCKSCEYFANRDYEETYQVGAK